MRRFSRYGFSPFFSPALNIVSASTPAEAAAAARSFAPPSTTATLPVIRDDSPVFPESIPPQPVTDPSLPAEFPPYTIRPEVIGSPVDRGVVPGMYDQSTLTSLFPSLVGAQPSPTVPQDFFPPALTEAPSELASPSFDPNQAIWGSQWPGAQDVPAPSPVEDIFNTRANDKIDQAVEMDYAANLQRDIAADLQRKADNAAYLAQQADSRATMDPTYDAQAAAEIANVRANDAQYLADQAHAKADVIDQAANDKAAEANQATEQIAAAEAHQQQIIEESVAQADQQALDEAVYQHQGPGSGVLPPADWRAYADTLFPPTTTDLLQPPASFTEPVTVPGFSVSPIMAAGVAGVVGFLLGGARGGAVGAVLGGGAAYFMRQQHSPQPVRASSPSPAPTYLPEMDPANWGSGGSSEFTPYQEADGTWIMSRLEQLAYNSAPIR